MLNRTIAWALGAGCAGFVVFMAVYGAKLSADKRMLKDELAETEADFQAAEKELEQANLEVIRLRDENRRIEEERGNLRLALREEKIRQIIAAFLPELSERGENVTTRHDPAHDTIPEATEGFERAAQEYSEKVEKELRAIRERSAERTRTLLEDEMFGSRDPEEQERLYSILDSLLFLQELGQAIEGVQTHEERKELERAFGENFRTLIQLVREQENQMLGLLASEHGREGAGNQERFVQSLRGLARSPVFTLGQSLDHAAREMLQLWAAQQRATEQPIAP